MKIFNLELTWNGVRSIFKKELIQLFRDPYLVAFIIALPIVQLLVTGLAVERDLKHIATVVCNYDKQNASIELEKAFDKSRLFDIQEYVYSQEAVVSAIRQGKYRVGIIIPPNYSETLQLGQENAKVDVVLDGTQGTIAQSIVNGAKLIVANQSREMLERGQLHSNGGGTGLVDMRAKILYNPEMKSSYFLVPAILAIVMHMLTILFTSFAIVRERESGTLEQLMVTPIRPADLMVGKVLPYAAIGFVDMILTLVVMIWFFDIPITGSFWFLCLASIVFIFTSLGIGLLISTTCQTQVQSIQVTTGFFLPSLLLSGFVFPLEPIPWFIKMVSYCLPMTYYLDIIRGVVIKGTGPQELWFQTIVLLGLAGLLMGASVLRFKKQIA
ncbi:MAG: ABC transporter permease [Vampirovibrionales bacterium]|nr:ABC transporter permease [Vampirovibrionales bacterium]